MAIVHLHSDHWEQPTILHSQPHTCKHTYNVIPNHMVSLFRWGTNLVSWRHSPTPSWTNLIPRAPSGYLTDRNLPHSLSKAWYQSLGNSHIQKRPRLVLINFLRQLCGPTKNSCQTNGRIWSERSTHCPSWSVANRHSRLLLVVWWMIL